MSGVPLSGESWFTGFASRFQRSSVIVGAKRTEKVILLPVIQRTVGNHSLRAILSQWYNGGLKNFGARGERIMLRNQITVFLYVYDRFVVQLWPFYRNQLFPMHSTMGLKILNHGGISGLFWLQ